MGLNPKHLKDLKASGLSDQQIAACGFYSLEDPQKIQDIIRWGSPPKRLGPALVIPYPDTNGKRNCYARIKPDNPREKKGKRFKYEAPKGLPNRAYFPPGTIKTLNDPSIPLLVTEGEKKAARVDQDGFPCVAIPGVYAWQIKRKKGCNGKPIGARELIPDLEKISWDNRTVFIVFDSDAATNFKVRQAEFHLAEVLKGKGAKVRVVRLQPGPTGEKVGLDDYLLTHTPDDLRKLLRKAKKPTRPPKDKKETPTLSQGEPLTDLWNAKRMKGFFGDQVRHCFPWKKDLIWDRKRWAQDETGELESLAKETVRRFLSEAAKAPSENDRKALALHAVKCQTNRKIRDMISLFRSEPGIPVLPRDLDLDPLKLNCLNGTLDLRTGKLSPHDPRDMITKLCPVEYLPNADCPLWEKMLWTILAQKMALIEFLQKLVGYCLTGSVQEQGLFLFYGTGANGKSTVINTLLAILGPDFAIKASRDLFMARKQDNHPAQLARLFGKRLVVAVETHEGARLDEGLVKELTGGDPITARGMREDPWQFNPSHKAILVTNHKPEIRGTDEGMWRRVRMFPFAFRIPDEEQDKTLSEKLLAEAPGILAWAVRGCLKWQRDGLKPPPEVVQATQAYRAEQDVLAAFLAERCLVDPMPKVMASELYTAFCQWSKENGEAEIPQRRLSGALSERGFVRKRGTGGVWFWHGIGLHSTQKTNPLKHGKAKGNTE